MTATTLRPMLPGDAAALAALFRSSIGELGAEDYDEGQREAWAARADDEAAFAKALAGSLTLVAIGAGVPVGFASLAGPDKVAMLYVDPGHARRGIASMLLDALVRLAGGRGAARLSVDASDCARDFFAARGFVASVRNTVPLGDQWLGNTTMTRTLAKGDPKLH